MRTKLKHGFVALKSPLITYDVRVVFNIFTILHEKKKKNRFDMAYIVYLTLVCVVRE